MKTKNAFRYLMVAATVGIFLTSCRKQKDEPKDTDTSAASDNALAEGTYSDVHNIADEAANGTLTSYMAAYNSQEKAYLSSCATITNDSVSVPHILTIDFGTANCLCNDGRNRRGIINVSYSGHYRDSASTHTITFTNYYVNDNHIMGTKTVTNNGHNASGNLSYSVVVNGTIVKTDGKTISWNSTRTREWIVGETTLPWNDDVYLITGNASGTSSAGTSFNMTITSALRKEIGCHHIVSGTLTITPSGKPTRYVDFGTGACDNQATVTINGNVYNITLN
jgi:archaellum component FlaF (FlaF/FlaG flagellin family)